MKPNASFSLNTIIRSSTGVYVCVCRPYVYIYSIYTEPKYIQTNSYSSGMVFVVTKSLVVYLFALSFRYTGLNHSKREWYRPKWMCGVLVRMAFARSPEMRLSVKTQIGFMIDAAMFRLYRGRT